ncbi:hypothetical protein SDC9_181556 [bioreactor metagenome]|uniref:Uncharacterized protein n=1 Tax=bioreactor metagenome TaxID=1076179 RepID=A0A645HD93_9ZZZZ
MLYIMVSPHNIELHLVVVSGFQETVIQGALQIGTFLIPVPVVYKYIHAMVNRYVDPTFNYFRVVIQLIPPQWLTGLIMTFIPGIPFFDNFPLTDPFRP